MNCKCPVCGTMYDEYIINSNKKASCRCGYIIEFRKKNDQETSGWRVFMWATPENNNY